jgi:chromosome segregation ATPase
MQKEITTLCKENQELQEHQTTLENQFRQKETLHQEEVKALKEKVNAFEKNNESLRSEMSESKRIDDERIHKADQDLAKALQDVHKMDELNQNLQQTIQSLQQQLATQAQSNRETISSLNTEHNRTVSSLQTQNNENSNTINRLQNALNESQMQNRRNDGEIQRLTNTNNQAQAEIQSQASKIARAKALLDSKLNHPTSIFAILGTDISNMKYLWEILK